MAPPIAVSITVLASAALVSAVQAEARCEVFCEPAKFNESLPEPWGTRPCGDECVTWTQPNAVVVPVRDCPADLYPVDDWKACAAGCTGDRVFAGQRHYPGAMPSCIDRYKVCDMSEAHPQTGLGVCVDLKCQADTVVVSGVPLFRHGIDGSGGPGCEEVFDINGVYELADRGDMGYIEFPGYRRRVSSEQCCTGYCTQTFWVWPYIMKSGPDGPDQWELRANVPMERGWSIGTAISSQHGDSLLQSQDKTLNIDEVDNWEMFALGRRPDCMGSGAPQCWYGTGTGPVDFSKVRVRCGHHCVPTTHGAKFPGVDAEWCTLTCAIEPDAAICRGGATAFCDCGSD